ncbi:MAG: HipA domain-containing protein [Nitrospira sp.]|nr:HipA domain-containing protein [Nitrospira sp.]MDH5194218.1 HipA domain-containing protein [Nitrospira sp.]
MPDLEPYPIIPLRNEDVLAPEEMGSKQKGWVQVGADATPWLFKHARLSNGKVTGEHWAEKIAAELAELLEIPHAQVDLAMLDGAVGCISRRFAELSRPGTELIHGNDLLAGAVLGYDRAGRRAQPDHTIENIAKAVTAAITDRDEREVAFRQLAGFVTLDALILNTDRHHENWALMRSRLTDGMYIHRVAPTFDHASSLGRNEPVEKVGQWLREADRFEWYAARGRGAIFIKSTDPHGANPLRLMEVAARAWPRYFQPWGKMLQNVGLDRILSVVDRVPDHVMDARHRRFAKGLLGVTFRQVTEALS